MTLRSLVPGITTDDATAHGEELSEDEIFDILSNRRRRFVVHALVRADEPMDICELSIFVTAWHLGIDPDDVEYEDRRNVYSTLRRTHLPKMEAKGLVTVDEENSTVEPTPTLQDLDVYVEVLEGWEIPWGLYYVGLAGTAAVFLLAVATGAPGFAGFEPLDVGVFTVATFGVSSVVHNIVDRRTRLGNTEKPPETRKMHERRHPNTTAPRE